MNQPSYAPDDNDPANPGGKTGRARRKRNRANGGVYRDRIDHWRDGDSGQFVPPPSKAEQANGDVAG